ncbi:MAG: beta-phosphoglucomutase family hydrolase [Anaerolineaceae bacterium]|nr:beta-phosphoglucomutase family hydrolase [Anaerolineaceae bacterium]
MFNDRPGAFAAIWDMDGVLVDTGEFHFSAWKRTFDDLGQEFTRDMFRATFGMNNRGILITLINQPLDEAQISKISDGKEIRFRTAIKSQLELLPGVKVWLERFRAAGVKQALASSAPQKNIDTVIDELALDGYFQVVVSGAMMAGKPDPAVFLEAARLLGLAPTRCVVFEDAIAGVEAARRARMKCIAVTTTNPPDLLNDANVVIDHFEELIAKEIWDLID